MLAVHPLLPLLRAVRPRARSVRKAFRPGTLSQPYRLPHEARDRLASSLAPYRNREAAFALAVFVARWWSAPKRIVEAFVIDRRALAGHVTLGLSERKVRSAIRVLEEVGFLDRAVASGSRYKPTADGLRCKPIRFMFGREYFDLFDAANKRAARIRGRAKVRDRDLAARTASHPSVASAEARPLKCPESHHVVVPQVHLGHLVEGGGIPPEAFEANPNLGRALDDLLKSIRLSRDGSGEGSAR